MQKLPKPTEPSYAINSVDNALHLIQMLRDRGEVRIHQAAKELGVAESTVHRLMAMLVYRGFAVQDDARVYRPGQAVGVGPAGVVWSRELIDIVAPHMHRLCTQTGETINLIIRVGTNLHVLWSVEGSKMLRVVQREGVVMPARSSAAGMVLLADLPADQLRRLYQEVNAEFEDSRMGDEEFAEFVRKLSRRRRAGHVVSHEAVEVGVSALALPLRDADGRAVAAVGIAVPAARSRSLSEPSMIQAARDMQAATEADLHSSTVSFAAAGSSFTPPPRSSV